MGVALVGMAMRSSPSDAHIDEGSRPTNVKVQVLRPMTVYDEVALMGSLEPWEDVTLSAKTPGEIERQGVEEGQVVQAGRELLRIDTKSIQVSFEQAQAQYKAAARELERLDQMREEGISSPQQRDRALVDYEVASTNLRATELKLADSVINAKFDGVVDTLYQEEGEYVNIGAALVRLVELDRVKLVIGIPERDVAYFSKGDPVTVRLDAFPEKRFFGTIFLIAATAEQSTHTFTTEIALDNADGKLKPGMIAQARLVRQSFPDSIMIPIFSLITTDTGRRTFIDADGVAREREVEVGFLRGKLIHVREGLKPGDRLIVVGQRDLRDGDRIEVREVIE